MARADGGRSVATWGAALSRGDTVQTGRAAQVTLLFSDGRMLTVGPDSRVVVSAGRTLASEPRMDPATLANITDLTLHRTGVGEIAALGGLRSGERQPAITPVSPLNTMLRDPRPVFSWTATEPFRSFTVTISSSGGTVWSASTEDHSLAYPVGAPSLEAGSTYYWQVEGDRMLDQVRGPVASFSLLTGESRSRVAEAEQAISSMFADGTAGDASRLLALGAVYAGEGLFQDAIGVFERIGETQGESALLLEILGKLYDDTGQKDRALAVLRRALELNRSR